MYNYFFVGYKITLSAPNSQVFFLFLLIIWQKKRCAFAQFKKYYYICMQIQQAAAYLLQNNYSNTIGKNGTENQDKRYCREVGCLCWHRRPHLAQPPQRIEKSTREGGTGDEGNQLSPQPLCQCAGLQQAVHLLHHHATARAGGLLARGGRGGEAGMRGNDRLPRRLADQVFHAVRRRIVCRNVPAGHRQPA